MADVKGLLSDPEFQKLDTGTQKQVLGKVDSAFAGLSDEDFSSFKQRMGPSIAPSVPGMEKLGGAPPGPPKPPNPMTAPEKSDAPDFIKDSYEAKFGMPAPDRLGTALRQPTRTIAAGVAQIANANAKPVRGEAPTTPGRQLAGGASKIIRGSAGAVSGPEVIGPVVAAAPVAAALGLAGSKLGGSSARAAVSATGAAPEYQDLAEDVGAITGGAAGAKYGPDLPGRAATAAEKAGIPQALRNSAQEQYNQVINATRGPNKIKSQRAVAGYEAPAPDIGPGKNVRVPGLLERGVTAVTQKGLLKKFNAALDRTTQSLENEWENLPGQQVTPADRVYGAIDSSIEKEFGRRTPSGEMAPTGPDARRGFDFGDSLKEYLRAHEVKTPDGQPGFRYETLRDFRRDWDSLVDSVNGYQGDLANNVAKSAYRAAANGIRNIVNGDNPTVAAINREVSFWSQAADALAATVERKTGQASPLGRKMMRGAGAAVGFSHGGPLGAAKGAAALEGLESAATSPAWRTMSAVAKNRIADAITAQARQAFVPKGLLTEGSIKMGPKPDESGPTAARPYPWETKVMTEPKLLPEGSAPFTQGTVVPDILGKPGRTSHYMLEGPPQPAVPTSGRTFYGPPAGAGNGSPVTTGGPLTAPRGPDMGPDTLQPPRDTSRVSAVPGERAMPSPEPGVVPPAETQRLIERNTGQVNDRGRVAGPDWWKQQPPTRPELQQRYEQLFNRAENLSPQRPVQVPETGVPEGVARGVDARNNIARQVLKGRTWAEATPSERLVIDQLVSEGYGSAIPRYAKGGIINRPTLLVDAATRKPTGIMAEAGPEAILPMPDAVELTVVSKPDKPGIPDAVEKSLLDHPLDEALDLFSKASKADRVQFRKPLNKLARRASLRKTWTPDMAVKVNRVLGLRLPVPARSRAS